MTPNRRNHLHPADDTGQTLTEYALLVSLIAVGAAVALPAVTSGVEGMLAAAAAALGG